LPCQFADGITAASLRLDGSETFDLLGTDGELSPKQPATLRIISASGSRDIPVIVRIDTPIEVEYYRNGGIVPYVLRNILTAQDA
jgi:aconitate hydratase